jgi:hypothetical protein
MGDPRAVEGILDEPVAGLDDIGGDGADKGIECLCLDRVHHASANLSWIETSGGQTLGQHRFVSRPDLRAAHVVGRLRAPRGIFVLTGPGHSTETPTLVPSSSCSNASDSERTAYLLIEYGP